MKQWMHAVCINTPTHRTDFLGLAQTVFIVKYYPDCPRAEIYCMKLLLAVNWKRRDFQRLAFLYFIRTRPCPEAYRWTLFLRWSLCISMTVSSWFLHLLVQTCTLWSLSSRLEGSLWISPAEVICGQLYSHIAKTPEKQNVSQDHL